MKYHIATIVILCVLMSAYAQEEHTALTSTGRMRYFESENENVLVGHDYATFVRVSNGDITQKKYDDNQRLVSEIRWLENAENPTKIIAYTYKGKNPYIQSKMVDDFSLNERTLESFDDEGKIIKKEVYSLSISDTNEIDDSQTKRIAIESFKYDEKNRLIEEKIVYDDDIKNNKEIIYEYMLGEESPDLYEYSGQELKKSIVYSSSKDWIETTFFSNSLSVQTVYTQNIPSAEIVYENNIKIRERIL